MKYNVQINLTLSDESWDIPALAASLATAPDQAEQRGSRDARRVLPRRSTMTFESRAADWDADFQQHWEELRDRLRLDLERLAALAVQGAAAVTIVVDHRGRFPALFMPQDFIAFVARMGASLDIDVYEETVGTE